VVQMIRPVLKRPTLQSWKEDDVQIAEFLEDISKHKLNVESDKYWNFYVPALRKYFSHGQLWKLINKRFIEPQYSEALKEMFRYLPERFKIISEEMMLHFTKLTLNRQESYTYIEEANEYMDELEEQNQSLRKDLVLVQEKIKSLEIENKNILLQAENNVMKKLLGKQEIKVENKPKKESKKDEEPEGIFNEK